MIYQIQVIFDLVPITNSFRVGVNYKGESMVYKSKNIKVTLNTVLEYNKIDYILVYEVEKAILLLEAYSLNLRHHSISKETGDGIATAILK